MTRTWEAFKRSVKSLLTGQLFVLSGKKSPWKMTARCTVRAGPNSNFWAKDIQVQLMTNIWLVWLGEEREGGVYRQSVDIFAFCLLF